MKKEIRFCKRRGLVLLLVWMLLGSFVTGGTWFVDPVNGNDEWNGLWLEYFPDSDLGPVATLETAVNNADWRDTIILLDGIYAGPENTGQAVFDMIVDKSLHLCSLNGSDNCILELSYTIYLRSNRPTGNEIIQSTFDGITFESNRQDRQVGINMYHIYLLFQNCTFKNFGETPLISNDNEVHLELEDCTFKNNSSYYMIRFVGGSSILKLKGCLFQDNEISVCAVSVIQGVETIFTDCVFDRNHMHNLNRSDLSSLIKVESYGHAQISHCRFTNNTSSIYCSLIDVGYNASSNIDSCVIENNMAEQSSPSDFIGIHGADGADIHLSNTRIEHLQHLNINRQALGIQVRQPATLVVDNCRINFNSTGLKCFGGQFNGVAKISVSDTEFLGNAHMYSGEPYDGCGISVIEAGKSSMLIERCTFSDNKNGTFLDQQTQSSIMISNCLYTNNETFALNSLGALDSQLQVTNCTFVDHDNGIHAMNTHFKNCILRNTFFYNTHPWQDNVTVDYSCVEDGWNGPGTGNFSDHPLFADYYGGDYHLKSQFGRYDPASGTWVLDTNDSPCVDTGDPGDFVGNEPYSSGGRINMGCYGGTWQASKSAICSGGLDGNGKMLSDFNHDCFVNLTDFAWFASEWLQSTISQ